MDSLNDCIQYYTTQLNKGQIQKAYKGIMTFMSDLSKYLEARYPDYTAGALYFGYMDMTYFAFTPPALRNRKLKIAIVYLHKEGRFEAWLGGNNRTIQSEYIDLLRKRGTGKYKLSEVKPGVDSIIESILVEQPVFDSLEVLRKQIETKLMEFVSDITTFLSERS
jgi:hypothetical protein